MGDFKFKVRSKMRIRDSKNIENIESANFQFLLAKHLLVNN
jgi:hypothetical protein